MQKLVCVGGPHAGEVFDVELNQPAVVIPRNTPEDEPGNWRGYDTTLYTIDRVSFSNRTITVLLHPPMRAQGHAAQEHAIVKALCKPEVYELWANGLRRPERPCTCSETMGESCEAHRR